LVKTKGKKKRGESRIYPIKGIKYKKGEEGKGAEEKKGFTCANKPLSGIYLEEKRRKKKKNEFRKTAVGRITREKGKMEGQIHPTRRKKMGKKRGLIY